MSARSSGSRRACSSRPPALDGTVELIVEAEGDQPERQYLVTLAGGRAEISEVGGRRRRRRVRGTVQAWVRALGPDGSTERLTVSGRDGLAGAVLDGFSRARSRAASRRAPSPRSDPGAPSLKNFFVDAVDAHDLVARCLTADHADARRRHLRRSRHERAQRRVRLAVDRRRGHADDDRAGPLADDLVAAGARLKADGDRRPSVPGVGLEPTRP